MKRIIMKKPTSMNTERTTELPMDLNKIVKAPEGYVELQKDENQEMPLIFVSEARRENGKAVKVIKLTTEESVQKEIFCMNEDEKYWSKEVYDQEVEALISGQARFADAGYDIVVELNDYIIKIDDGYGLPVKAKEIDNLGINIVEGAWFDYKDDVISLVKHGRTNSLRELQILSALSGRKQFCIEFGEKFRSRELSIGECCPTGSNIIITDDTIRLLNNFLENHMPKSLCVEGSDTDKFKNNIEYLKKLNRK